MSNISFDLSGKIDRQTVEILAAVKKMADPLGIPFFVVGASARDFILKHCYGIEPKRRTEDIDLGIEVSSWEQFNQLTGLLITAGHITPTEEKQRFRFKTIFIDIVPFGPITDQERRITWPPEQEIFMSMLGFKEAYEHAIEVRLSSDPELDIRLPTLPGLALMKIISWREKYPERRKDAEDLKLIMHKYEQVVGVERLYEMEQNLLIEEKFDTEVTCIRLLGRDMGKISDPDTQRVVVDILDNEIGQQSQYRLVTDMITGSLAFDEHFDEVLLEVEKLRQGILEAKNLK